MKIVEPSVQIVFHYPICPENVTGVMYEQAINSRPSECIFEDGHVEQFLEKAGRTYYKSENKITSDSAPKFIKMLNDRGHKAMLEHCFASCKFICDRGVTHELVRHRIVSYAQESTRYCNYGKNKFGSEISVIKPPGLDTEDKEQYWKSACLASESMYMKLIDAKVPPQIARSVLPICLKTEIWASTNLREWQHIFSLRCAKTAHPQIRALMLKALEIFKDEVPSMFAEMWRKYKELEVSKVKS